MSKDNNIQDLLHDVADAIREKKGTTDLINPQDFSSEIASIETSSSMWTGHADVEGLKAIGWDDDDIAYFQEHGVNWMEEDDVYHKVSDDNKALYGVLTVDNIQEYKDRIVYLPKIDLSGSLYLKFKGFSKLKGLPILDLGRVTNLNQAFYGCGATCLCLQNTSKISSFASAFRECTYLMHINHFDTSTNGARDYALYGCIFLKEGVPVNISGTYDIRYLYSSCTSMMKCGDIDASGRDISTIFATCRSLSQVKINNLCSNLDLKTAAPFSGTSLLYMIEHEAATEDITITLHASVYARLAEDPDIVEALSNHPLVTLASA